MPGDSAFSPRAFPKERIIKMKKSKNYFLVLCHLVQSISGFSLLG